jgi:DNA processing protein
MLPWSRDRRRWWLLWSRCPGLGIARLALMEERFGTLRQAWLAPAARLGELPGFGTALLRCIEAHRRRWGEDPWGGGAPPLLQERRVLLPGDPARPAGFDQLPRPPHALHWQGRGSLWAPLRQRRAVAVVGTRRPSLHGLSMARAIGGALGAAGWPVVSGLAEGIDAAAHRGCLDSGGRPVAVLGTPLERVYPRHHAALQAEVASRGLLISEHPSGAAVLRGHFAARNRLQVALAAALVVVECPHRSGALHSATLAWELGLPLWVVPADAGKASAAGSNRLLQQGASPLLDPQDLIAQLGPGPLAGVRGEISGRETSRPPSPGDRSLLDALGPGASLEQLCRVLQRSPADLAPRLLALELAGAISAEPGLCWRRR